MSRTTDMTQGSPIKLVLRFSIPLIATNLGQQLYMIVDAAIVGRGIGVNALAAVGAADWSVWLILWTVSALAQAFATFVARDFGSRDIESMNRTIAMSSLLSLLVGGALMIAGLLMAEPLLTMLGTPENIYGDAATYLKTMISGTLVVTAYNMAASILRALGDGRSPLTAMVIAAVMNIALDILFVTVFHWGVFGAAIASVLSQLVSFLYCFGRIRRTEGIRFRREEWKVDVLRMRRLLLFGLPIACQFIVISLSGIVAQSAVNAQGSTFLAGYTAANKLYGLMESMAISLGMAFSTFFAQNYGAGRYERVRRGVRTAALLCAGTALVVGALTALSGRFLVSLFIAGGEAGAREALDIAYRYILTMSACLVLLYLLHVYNHALQGIGNSFWSLVCGVTESAGRVVTAKLIAPRVGPGALFFVEPAAWLCDLLFIMTPYYFIRRRLPREDRPES